jgi:tetratricopeptide (TPR) repeat protein
MVMKGLISRVIALGLMCLVLNACTPQASLIASLLPGPLSMLLGNLQRVDDRNLRRVAELERSGQWEELVRVADEHVKKQPSNTDWWLLKGYAHAQLAQHATAAEAFTEAVRLEPDNAPGWHLLAQAYRGAGQPGRAVNALNRGLLGLRDTTVALYLLGESYSDLKRYSDAVQSYRAAVERDPGFAAAWLGLTRAYTAMGRSDEARAARAQVERLDPKLAQQLR